MFPRRLLLGLIVVAPLGIGSARSAERVPFTLAAFAAAQQSGKPILVHVTATWCAVCNAQKPILSRLEADPRFKDLTVFAIDFDTQKEAVRQVGARMQSTLIAYKGGKEAARSVGETQPEWIEGVVEKAY